MNRVDSCLVPPGFIASAKMYSLILEGESLYMIFTGPGPASIVDYTKALLHLRQSRDALVNAAVKAVINSYVKGIQTVETKINPSTLASLSEDKNSRVFPKSSIKNAVMSEKETYIKLSFVADGKKMSFDCTLLEKDNIRALVDALSR